MQDATVDPLAAAVRQLTEYFAGTRREFDLPLRLQGTAFQQRVWRELTKIPYRRNVELRRAREAHQQSQRARAPWGLPMAAIPSAIIVPCHRVIGADGSLTGYGGGIERKRWLLAHEGGPAELTWASRSNWRAIGELRRLDQRQSDGEQRAAAVRRDWRPRPCRREIRR